MENELNLFGRSGRTIRTPPAQVSSRTNQSHILDPTQQSCKLCSNFDNLDMVQCDGCNSWCHFVCAGVTADIVHKNFFCENCTAKALKVNQTRGDEKSTKSSRTGESRSSKARSEARRRQLALDRIEEERILKEARDKEYLDKKYQTLESFSIAGSSDSEPGKEDEEVTRANAVTYTEQWVNNQTDSVNVVDSNCTQSVNNQDQEVNDLVDVTIPDPISNLQCGQSHTQDIRFIGISSQQIEQQNQLVNLPSSTINNQSPPLQQSVVLIQDQNHDRRTDGQLPIQWEVNNRLVQSTMVVPISVEPAPVTAMTTDRQVIRNNSKPKVAGINQPTLVRPSIQPKVSTSDIWNDIQPYESSGDSLGNQFTPTPWLSDLMNPVASSQDDMQSTPTTKLQTAVGTTFTLPFAPIHTLHRNTSLSSNFISTGYRATLARSDAIPLSSTIHTKTSYGLGKSQYVPTTYAVSSRIIPPSVQYSQRQPTTQLTGFQQFTGANAYQTYTAPQATQSFGQIYTEAKSQGRHGANQYSTIPVPQMPQMPQSSSYVPNSVHYQNVNGQSASSNYAPPNYQTSFDPRVTQIHSSHQNANGHVVSSNHRPTNSQPLGVHQFNSVSSQPISSNYVSSNTQSVGYHQFNNPYQALGNSQPATSQHYPLFAASLPPNTANVALTTGQTLNQSQISARQVVPRKLPAFYGEIEKFPAFIRAYETSTALCGYTDGENLSRLADSLKGVALEYVEQQLCYPDDVPHVIESLKMMFGKPEFVIEKLMAKISKQASPQAEDLSSLVKFSMSVQNVCGTIKSSNLTEHLTNPTLMKALVDKLPPSIQLNWACHKQNIPNANLDTLGMWLHELAKVASSISGPPKVKREKNPETTSQKGNQKQDQSLRGYVNVQIESPTATKKDKTNNGKTSKGSKKCPVCNQSSCQRIKDCKKFVNLNSKERWSAAKEHELCIRCFGNHRLKGCKSKQKCNVGDCQKPHNSLLHESGNKLATNDSEEKNKDDTTNVNCSHQSINRKLDIFRIVPVKLYHNNRCVQTFAYLDDGSNVTTIENDLANELNLESSANENLCVKWSFGKIRKTELVSRRVSLGISGVQTNAAIYELHNVRTVTDLALPYQTITLEWLSSYKHLEGIAIAPYENAKPRMLIGLQYSKLMVSQRTVEGAWSEPIACKTRLGWVVQGPDGGDESDKKSTKSYSINVCECQRNDDCELHMMVKEFFSWDSFGVKITNELLESKDVQRARRILESTTKKINGRYETGLLWRYDDVEFPETYPMALKRLECLERKMKKDPVLATKMCDYIQDFIQKGYVRKMAQDELQRQVSRVFYLPMFPVFNPKKPEKFRVVWDAAAMVNKISLNSMLLTGPDLLNPLPYVLRRFREKAIAITGDMKEMFHQVRVIDRDVHAQRFLWHDGNSKRKPEVFVVEVLTFGGKNSPSSPQYVKNTNALEYKDQFPRAVEAITDNHYQDDMLESFDTVEETTRLTEEVKLIHRNGGFEMRNFKSNSNKVLEKLGEKLENHQKNLDISTEPATERVLGMFWNTSSDTFTFSLKFTKVSEEVLKGIRRPTKREVLSAIMSIFDPLGLIAQYLVYGKILLQKIWRDGTDWDEKLSESSYNHWLTWIEVLPKIEEIEIPRWYSPKLVSTNQKRIQLHMFADASVEACAAAVYYRIEDEEGVDCCLIGGKTKVAPNKPLSVPRLELQAAVLGLRLVNDVSKCQNIQVTERFFWSDSQTVLGWINSEARKFHQYVAFRIGEILENSSTTEWNWVETKQNVADDATKWVNKPDLSSSARWYKAPSFLYQPQDTWHNVKGKTKFSTDEEMRAVYLLAHIEIPSNNIINTKDFSNWRRVERAMAYALRFIDNSRLRKKDRRIGPFMREEYIRARNTLFRQAQREEFLDEILVIRNNESLPVGEKKELHKSSVLRTCSPYLDEDGLLRMRGRIDAAQSVSFKTKRPLILPRHNYITKLLVYSYHQRFHHVNHQATLNQITQTFHIPSLRVVLKGVIENLCQRCKNDKAKPVVPEMAELPPARLSTFTRVFSYVGVDYFGPLKVKVRRSPEKRWGVIFTCLTTRAVYIDVAHSYDTSSCIFCIRNFSNRNGPPVAYYSDNGTNFYGAERELREEFQKMNKSKIEETFTTEHTQWFFNPPTAAHMGGVWERPIRTVKSALKKLTLTRLPTDEMLKSYLIEIENIINSTPLTYVQLDNIDDEVLTPNHFLKGSSSGMKSPGRFDPKSLCRDDWKAVQVMVNQFWRQFVLEYLPTLTRRTKWLTEVKQLEVGDLVIDCDEDSDRNDWRKGIIEEVAIGKRNQVRRAKVKMIRGEKAKLSKLDIKDIKHQSLWRPASKLAILDVKGNRLSSSPEAVNKEGNVGNAS